MMAVLVINKFPSFWDRITNKLDSWNTFCCMGKYKWIPMFWAAIFFHLLENTTKLIILLPKINETYLKIRIMTLNYINTFTLRKNTIIKEKKWGTKFINVFKLQISSC